MKNFLGNKKQKVMAAAALCLALTVPGKTLAASWGYDFNPGDDIGTLTIVNPTGNPTISLDASPGNLEMHIPGDTAYDLASWVNLYAPRLYRAGGGEPFTFETKIATSATTHTFLSGLFLYNSADGISTNDLLFTANTFQLKIDQGYPNNHSGAFAWNTIGTYTDLYLQVQHDGAGNYDFNYKKSAGDPWILYAELAGYSFDYLGIITKISLPRPGIIRRPASIRKCGPISIISIITTILFRFQAQCGCSAPACSALQDCAVS